MTNAYIPIFRTEEEYNRYQEDMIEKVVKRVIDGFSHKENKYLTRQQVANMLNIKFPTLHAWINDGKLTARKIGGRTLFLEDEIKQAIEKKEVYKFKHNEK